MTQVESDPLASLRASISGEVCLPGTTGYDEATNIWNGAITKRPSVVVRCRSAADVAAAITYARGAGLELSVRGGGHAYSGSSLTDGGLTIDLSLMRDIMVDGDAKRAICSGGATWEDLDGAAQAHGLAVPGGFISHTGVGGLTLGGGFGWLSRKAGLSCDNLVGAELVTADGTILHLSDDENADLFWAIRGGGGNFGVVTTFEFALHEVGPMVQLGFFFYGAEDAPALLRFAREYVDTLPDDSGVALVAMNAPPEPFVPEQYHFAPAYALGVLGLTDAEAHEALLAPIRAASVQPLFEMVTPIPYAALQQMFNASAPWGAHAYEKALYLEELTDGAIDVMTQHFGNKTSMMSNMVAFILGGAFARQPEDRVAFGGSRSTKYLVNINAAAMDAESLAPDVEWVRSMWTALLPHAQGTGAYINFMAEADPDRVRSSFGAKYERLSAIKAKVDPDNVFHLNPNIKPGA